MLIIKSSQFESKENYPVNSITIGVYKLIGHITEKQNHADQALRILERGLESNRYFGINDINRNSELVRLLESIMGNGWQRIVSGSVL